MTIDLDLVPTTKSLASSEDPSISDSSGKSPQCQCDVPLVEEEWGQETPGTHKKDDPATDENALVLDSVVSTQRQDEVAPWKIDIENCNEELDPPTKDDPVSCNSEATTSPCLGAPSNKEEKDDSDDEHEPMDEEWPQAFYCQRTHILMTDPLVGPYGSSVDRSAVDKTDDLVYYSNRALQAIIQETMSLRKHPFRAGLKQLQQSVSHGLSSLLSDWNSHESLFRPLNDAFYCPITYNLMHQPVIDPEGNTFERVAVENWIRMNQSSPITRADLGIDQLYPNMALAKLLQEEKEKPEDQMHPAIRKWKDEPIPSAMDVELGGRAVRELEYQRRRRDGQNSTLVVVSSPQGGSPVFYPMTYQQLLVRTENSRRARYRFVGSFLAGCFLITFVFNEHLVFLSLFLLSLLFVFSKRPIFTT